MAEEIVFCKGGGCTAKLGAGVLSRVLSALPKGQPVQTCLSDMTAEMTQRSIRCRMIWPLYRRWIFFRPWWTIRTHLDKLRRQMR